MSKIIKRSCGVFKGISCVVVECPIEEGPCHIHLLSPLYTVCAVNNCELMSFYDDYIELMSFYDNYMMDLNEEK